MQKLLLVLLAVLLAACSKVTQENFARVKTGMTEQEVAAILGSPTESTTNTVLGLSGTTATWSGGGALITIRYLNGKVAVKNFENPAPKKK